MVTNKSLAFAVGGLGFSIAKAWGWRAELLVLASSGWGRAHAAGIPCGKAAMLFLESVSQGFEQEKLVVGDGMRVAAMTRPGSYKLNFEARCSPRTHPVRQAQGVNGSSRSL